MSIGQMLINSGNPLKATDNGDGTCTLRVEFMGDTDYITSISASATDGNIVIMNGTSGKSARDSGVSIDSVMQYGENIGTSGYGLFSDMSGPTAQFKNIVAGSNITITSTATDLVINGASGGSGGGGVSSFAAFGSAQLTGDVTISASGNIVLTQNGQDVQIYSAPGGSSGVSDLNSLTGSVTIAPSGTIVVGVNGQTIDIYAPASGAAVNAIAASGSSNLTGNVLLAASGEVQLAQSGQTITIFAPTAPASGAAVNSLAASGSAQLTGNVILAASGGAVITESGQTITIFAPTATAAAVNSVAVSGSTPITGAVTFSPSGGITLTESGQNIQIYSSIYTDQMAEDAVGGILTNTTSVGFTYNSGAHTIQAAVAPSAVDHNSLANLTTGDPHTQYALLAGRAAGQTLNGGSATGTDLRFNSNSTATLGNVYVGQSYREYSTGNVRVFGATGADPNASGVLAIKKLGANTVTAFNFESPAGVLWTVDPQDGQILFYKQAFTETAIGWNTSNFVTVGTGSGNYKFQVSRASTSVAPSAIGASDPVIAIRNTSVTNNNYSALVFQNSNGGSTTNWGAGIVGVNENHLAAASGTGHMQMWTRNAGALAERWRLKSDGTLTNKVAANESTGAGSAALGANCPAVTPTAPYTWLKIETSDGSTVYLPVWK